MTGEFAAIERLRRVLPKPPPGETWIGDDAAVVKAPVGGWLLLAADAVVAGVHADLSLTGLDDLGWKAVAVNVSDIAAMGGRPLHALVTVAGPPETDLDLLYRGITAAAAAFQCPVVGGDLTNSPALVVTVAVTGTFEGAPLLRSGAKPGDHVYVTGPLGLAAAGLRLLKEGKRAPAAAVAAHRRPLAAVAAGLAARAAGATAMIDISDGLVADLGHIAETSGVGLALSRVPVGEAATFEEALTGGDDYVLAFTASQPARVTTAFAELSAPVHIGVCTADRATRTVDGRSLPGGGGWEHSWL
jgi:thiamine-monophosphate kinase